VHDLFEGGSGKSGLNFKVDDRTGQRVCFFLLCEGVMTCSMELCGVDRRWWI
jgi:hypothetical protein